MILQNLVGPFKRNIQQVLRYSHDLSKCQKCDFNQFQENIIQCKKCNFLIDPDITVTKMNYFELFGLTLNYNVDLKYLEFQYKEMMKNVHPDRFQSHTDGKQLKYSEQYSRHIIEGYQTLKDDIKRTKYYLECNGINEEEILYSQEDGQKFLMQLMMIREEIDDCSSKQELDQIKNQVQSQVQETQKALNEKLDRKKFEEAVKLLQAMKYHEQTVQAIQEKENLLEN